MPYRVNFSLPPETASDWEAVKKISCKHAGLTLAECSDIRIVKKSVDARRHKILVSFTVDVCLSGEPSTPLFHPFIPKDVSREKEVIIIGSGPAGLFAALRLIELGLKPLIIERGRDVSSRKKDIALINRQHIVNPDSNYCFGEGGAGTYSDGKLYTRSRKKGDNNRVFEILCYHGADTRILYEAHPHLGTDRLPGIIAAIRKSIIDSGGSLLFEKRVTDIITDSNQVKGVIVSENERYNSDYVILATGHSARDIYRICKLRMIDLEIKSFAMGVRVEHPQELIDHIQYHGSKRGEYLPAASYALVKQVDNRGVYSFCMCPGGFIVPAATSQDEIVVNGMSASRRNSPFANSGIVAEVRPEDLKEYFDVGEMAGLEYQKELEHRAWVYGGQTQRAPAQRLSDFIDGRFSSSLPVVSYFPGVTSAPVHELLPPVLGKRLRDGLRMFGSVMNGFLTNEAVVVGVESRTSSPIRIPRDNESLEHIKIKGLFPCGEGSGFAGGIVSSAIDGIRAAEAVTRKIRP